MSAALDGKIALVTGGGRNVGKAFARKLAAEGAVVIVNYFHSPEAARETVAGIIEAGGQAHAIRASVAVPAQVERMFEEIETLFGGLDILVNAAANGALRPGSDVDDAALDRALSTNLKGSLACSRRAAALMAPRGGGSIVNVSTLGGGQFVMANYLACGPAKAAVEALTRYLAVELAPQRIRVNTAASGMLESPVAYQFPDAERMHQAIVAATPLGRLGRPEELAEVVAFLASDSSRWITGQVVLADGGLSTGAALLSPAVAQPAVEHPLVSTPDRAPQAPTVMPGAAGDDPDDDVIAIVGMGLAVPGANDPDEYWQELLHGADRFVEIPADRWENERFYSPDHRAEDKTYSRHSAFVTDFVPHPALSAELHAAGLTPDDIESTTLWLRHSLLQALDGVTRREGDRCSFQVGYTADGSQHLEEATVVHAALTRLPAILARAGLDDGTIAQAMTTTESILRRRYPRSGPDPARFLPHRVGRNAMAGVLPDDTDLLLVDTACSSSLYAIDIGLKGILDGRHDIAVCGGAFAVGPRGSVLFAKLNGLSLSGEVRSLDRTGDGVLFSDGAAVVVLKRLSRARADGDRVLAIVESFGTSSDGKGQAIYAPSPAGQKIAIRRAVDRLEAATVSPDWVVAHATGTPAGDLAEFTTLREMFGEQSVLVTSNKSVIGHTGWAAGTASVIQVILGLQHETITPQHRFSGAPESFAVGSAKLRIPTEPMPWKPSVRPRTASVSGFGFGGTNAHMIVREPDKPNGHVAASRRPAAKTSREHEPERIAVVGRAVLTPDTAEPAAVSSLLERAAAGLTASFGDTFPLPPLERVRMPPGTLRSLDRCQLMILECARLLRDDLGEFWLQNQDATGVLLGHMGATRNAMLYAPRCYLDDMSAALRAELDQAQAPWLDGALDELRDSIRSLVPASNENSFPGMMPNVIPARVANYYDLHGLNMTVDTGFTSAASAIDIASRYLRQQELTMALVGGINGNSTAELREIIGPDLDADTTIAEGAFLLALVTESTARAASLKIEGYLSASVRARGAASARDTATIACGAQRAGRSACFLGAEAAAGVFQALNRADLASGAEQTIDVVCHGEADAPTMVVRVALPGEAAIETGSAPTAAIRHSEGSQPLPAHLVSAVSFDGGQPTRVARHTVMLTDTAPQPHRPTTAFWGEDATLVLTDSPQSVMTLDLPAGTTVLSTKTYAGVRTVRQPTPEGVTAALDGMPPARHIRVLTDLTARDGVDDDLLRLHDLLFLAVQKLDPELRKPGSSCLAVLLGGIDGGDPHPAIGLFNGLIKVISLEYDESLAFSVATDTRSVASAIATAEAESALRRRFPVVCYQDQRRLELTLTPHPAVIDSLAPMQLGPDSVVVAAGGGRGITAELLIGLSCLARSRLYVLGSNPLSAPDDRYLALDDEAFAAARSGYIADQLAARPGTLPMVISREYDRIRDARTTLANLARMTKLCGPGRVKYLQCDINDPEQVRAAAAQIARESSRIDLLVNAAGVNRSAPIASKDFAEFQRIRDIKVRGYQNLKRAFADNPPAAWCNFGSLLGVTGQIGEADYASGNDFLGTAAMHAAASGAREYTMGWTLWGEVGLGANALTKSYFEKSGLYSNMATAEGVHHFLREVNAANPSAYTAHLGTAEYGAVERLLPGALSGADPFAAAEAVAPYYLDRVASRSTDEITFERGFDLDRDGYLRHHQVAGTATLPGTFVLEIAFEAANALLPGLRAYAFEDLTFHHFLKVREGERTTKRIRARVVDRIEQLNQAVVEVRVSGDVVSRSGTVLVSDRLHFSVRVLMGEALPPAPRWDAWYPAEQAPVPDPYHVAGSPVLLTDLFVTTTDTRLHPLGKRSTYNLALPSDHPVFSRFGLPTLLIDGLARTGVLDLRDGHLVPLAAPLRIGRVDIYEHGNDAEVAARYGQIELYAVVPAPNPDGGGRGTGNRFVAVRPDGRMLLQFSDLDWTLMGHLDIREGTFRPGEPPTRPAEADRSMPALTLAGGNHVR